MKRTVVRRSDWMLVKIVKTVDWLPEHVFDAYCLNMKYYKDCGITGVFIYFNHNVSHHVTMIMMIVMIILLFSILKIFSIC